ncbi:MAG: hypothetical protein H6765_10695 [Candidatus Peribacteria bacterium]|nr:MAG: hypothetical protein H6765_10695 [Candidatus Peribacteria bacterium]
MIINYTQPFDALDIGETIRIYFDEDFWTVDLMTYYLAWYFPSVSIDRVPIFGGSAQANDEFRGEQRYLDYI